MYYHTGPRHGPHKAPSSGKRYKPGTYSDYMDSAEVASSIMSVPPMYRTKVVSLPRPLSSQVSFCNLQALAVRYGRADTFQARF